jgi:hypothetical protein
MNGYTAATLRVYSPLYQPSLSHTNIDIMRLIELEEATQSLLQAGGIHMSIEVDVLSE